MPDPQNAPDTSASTQTPPPVNLQGLRVRPADPQPERAWQTIKRNATPELDTSNAAKGPGHEFDSEASPQKSGEELYEGNFGSPLERAYHKAKNFISEHEDKLSEKYLAPFREGLDNIASDLQDAAETGHTKSGVPLTGPTRALVEGTGALLKQVPVGRTVRETVQMAVTPPEFPEAKALGQELKAGEKTAVNLEGIRYREVEPAAPKAAPKNPQHEKLFSEALAGLGPESKTPTPKIRANQSSESSASLEAQSRLQSEKAKGEKMYRVDSRKPSVKIPIASTVDAVDLRPAKFEHIVKVDKGGHTTILSSGDSARPINP